MLSDVYKDNQILSGRNKHLENNWPPEKNLRAAVAVKMPTEGARDL